MDQTNNLLTVSLVETAYLPLDLACAKARGLPAGLAQMEPVYQRHRYYNV